MSKSSTIKILVYLAVLMDVISIGIYIPLQEKLIDRYGVSSTMIALGLALYSLCAFFATPILGQLSDRYGRKWLLVACIAGTALSYLMLLGHHSFIIFLLSRIVNGITGGNFSILQATISDISVDDMDRKKNFGLMGWLFGLGFIIGPIVWSLTLGRGGVETVFIVGAVLALIDTLLMTAYLTETHKSKNPSAHVDLSSVKTIGKYLQNKNISRYLRSLIIIGIGWFSYQTSLPIETKQAYGIGGEYYGYILAAFGVITAINMAVLLPKLWLPRFSTRQLITIAHIGLGIILAGLTINGILPSGSFWIFLVLLIIQPVFNTILGPVYQWEIIAHSSPEKTGELTGVMSSIQTLTMVIGPVIGGILLDLHLPLYIVALLCAVVSLIVMQRPHWRKQPAQ